MNIWLLQIGEPLPLDTSVRKMRTALLADSLVARGHAVTWWASAFEHQRRMLLGADDASINVAEGYKIRLIKGFGYKKNVSIRRYLDHRRIARKFATRAAREDAPDLIVASMPSYDLAYEGVRYAKALGIPVVVDVRDLWPETFVNRYSGVKRWLTKSILVRDFIKLSYLLKTADGITAMSDGILDWALGYAERRRSECDRVFYLGYKLGAPVNDGSVGDFISVHLCALSGKKICVFVGTHGVSYELPLVIEVARAFERDEAAQDIHFVIAGCGEQTDMLQRKAAGLSNVSFAGWLNAQEISVLLRRAYLGLVPCRSVIDAFPNKPIEYLSAGLPIVSSVEGEMAAMVEKHGIGCNYNPGDSIGLYRCIRRIVDDPSLHSCMSAAARCVFSRYFDADVLYSDYSAYLEGFQRQTRSGSCYG